MNREINFRVYDTERKIMFHPETIPNLVIFPDNTISSIMQYIGIEDSKHKQAYEYDVILVKILNDDRNKILDVKGLIVWSNIHASFVLSSADLKRIVPFDFSTKFEILGNIFENQYLLNEINI